jgi:N-methylhydantoinase B/oxoprolinase/acetone carboxylase alpha subunit
LDKRKEICSNAKGYNSNLIKDIPIDTATFKAVIQQIDTGELYKEYAIKITLTITITITGRTQTIEFEGSEFC